MSCCYDVRTINQSTTTDVNRFLRILLQNRRLPWILSELAVAIDVRWILDSPVDALRVSDSALLKLVALLLERWLINWLLLLLLVWHAIRLLTAANSSWPALLWLLIKSLSLVEKPSLVKTHFDHLNFYLFSTQSTSFSFFRIGIDRLKVLLLLNARWNDLIGVALSSAVGEGNFVASFSRAWRLSWDRLKIVLISNVLIKAIILSCVSCIVDIAVELIKVLRIKRLVIVISVDIVFVVGWKFSLIVERHVAASKA